MKKYEMHLTIDPHLYYKAKEFCETLNGTQLRLMANEGGDHPLQLIISRGAQEIASDKNAILETKQFSNELTKAGFQVIRRKCVYELPTRNVANTNICYYEFRITIKNSISTTELIAKYLLDVGIKASFSTLVDRNENNQIYISLRYYEVVDDVIVTEKIEAIISRLLQMGVTIDKIHRQGCVLDDNIWHDNGWIDIPSKKEPIIFIPAATFEKTRPAWPLSLLFDPPKDVLLTRADCDRLRNKYM